MKYNWKQKNEIMTRKNISCLAEELKAFEQRIEERLTDEMGKINSIAQQINQILPILKDSVESDNENKEILHGLFEKLGKANADILSAQKNIESALNSKSELVMLNVEEVKKLIQLLAVNELLDEINVAEKCGVSIYTEKM